MDAGHFALHLALDADAIAEWMRDFLGGLVCSRPHAREYQLNL
jgi:hypothetical protein